VETRDRGSSDVSVRSAFVDSLQSFRDLANDDAVHRAWHGPSAVAGYSVAGLVGHVLSTASAVERYLDAEPGSGAPIVKGAYYAAVPTTADATDLHRDIRERGERLGELGQRAIVEAFDALGVRLRARLAVEPAVRTLVVMGANAMRLDDYLETRIVELAVHSDDLAASARLAVNTPPAAASIAVEHLLAVARQRHGDLALLRAFARGERDDAAALRVF
jgi:hypothetical protein